MKTVQQQRVALALVATLTACGGGAGGQAGAALVNPAPLEQVAMSPSATAGSGQLTPGPQGGAGSSAAPAYQPVFELPAGGKLLAAEGSRIVYGNADGSATLRDLGSGAEVGLEQSALVQYASDWQLSGGRVYACGQGPDCLGYCIYQWSGDGRLKNLSRANPYSTSGGGHWMQDLHPLARGDWVVWGSEASGPNGRYTVYRVSSGGYAKVGRPEGASSLGSRGYDAAEVGGVLHFYYWAQTGGEGASAVFDGFGWRSDTATSTRVTPASQRSLQVQTDGERVAWQQPAPAGQLDNGFALVVQPLAGGASTVLASRAQDFRLQDGVLAWTENTAAGSVLKASGAATTLSLPGSATLLASGGGQVVYAQQGQLWSWNTASGGATLRLDRVPSTVFATPGHLIFPLGSAVYRIGW